MSPASVRIDRTSPPSARRCKRQWSRARRILRLTLPARAPRPASPVHRRNCSAVPPPGRRPDRVQGAVRVLPVREAPQGYQRNGVIARASSGERTAKSLSLRITNLCYSTRRRPVTYSANPCSRLALPAANAQQPSRMIDLIRLAKASIANGLASRCMPGSRVPLPIATLSV